MRRPQRLLTGCSSIQRIPTPCFSACRAEGSMSEVRSGQTERGAPWAAPPLSEEDLRSYSRLQPSPYTHTHTPSIYGLQHAHGAELRATKTKAGGVLGRRRLEFLCRANHQRLGLKPPSFRRTSPLLQRLLELLSFNSFISGHPPLFLHHSEEHNKASSCCNN